MSTVHKQAGRFWAVDLLKPPTINTSYTHLAQSNESLDARDYVDFIPPQLATVFHDTVASLSYLRGEIMTITLSLQAVLVAVVVLITIQFLIAFFGQQRAHEWFAEFIRTDIQIGALGAMILYYHVIG